MAGRLSGNQVQYRVSDFNLEAPVGIHVILTDDGGDVAYTSFPEKR